MDNVKLDLLNTFFYRTPLVTASETTKSIPTNFNEKEVIDERN